jgi:hypothetical protein
MSAIGSSAALGGNASSTASNSDACSAPYRSAVASAAMSIRVQVWSKLRTATEVIRAPGASWKIVDAATVP